ncbi:MAG: nucleotidyltransferase domain-containing protein [Sulfurimonas sp.]|nr:nucleotidyltransferase domain-containing protein [Sulfurimonas sp.]
MFGLEDKALEKIREVLHANGVKKAFIFGSRAKGNYKMGSDVDLAVDANERQISYILNEETNLAYFFDVLNLEKIKNKNLLEHIKRVGIAL